MKNPDSSIQMIVNYQTESDPSLWMLLREGDFQAFEQLYIRHFHDLYTYSYKLTKEKQVSLDCLQELFVQIWDKKERLQTVQSVRFYLMKWLKRDIIRFLNDKNYQYLLYLGDDQSHTQDISIEFKPEEEEFVRYRAKQIRTAIDQLTKREREVVYLRFMMGMSYEEICEILSLNYQVVLNYQHRAFKSLKNNILIRNLAFA
jgi:RNA polymerase sigma factor (sigma-70 family)